MKKGVKPFSLFSRLIFFFVGLLNKKELLSFQGKVLLGFNFTYAHTKRVVLLFNSIKFISQIRQENMG